MTRPEEEAGREDSRALAARVNELLMELWIASERSGPRYDEFELTGQQYAVLGLIVTGTGMTAQSLAESLGVTKGAISQHLGVLERDGYISRRRSDRDGRVHVIDLEDRGHAYRDALQRVERSAEDRYLAALSADDLAQIVAGLSKLTAAFDD